MTEERNRNFVLEFKESMLLIDKENLIKEKYINQNKSSLKDLKSLISRLNLGQGGDFKSADNEVFFFCDDAGVLTFDKEQLTSQKLRSLLHNIHPYNRCPLVLLDVMGLAYEDVCTAMSLPRGNVMASLHYARRTLVPDIRRWDLPSNDLLIECGSIVDGGLEIPDEATYNRIIEEDERLEPYMKAIRKIKGVIFSVLSNAAEV